MRRSVVIGMAAVLLCGLPPQAQATAQLDQDQLGYEVRPGVAWVPGRAANASVHGTLAFLVTDGEHTYATTAGHVYRSAGNGGTAFEVWEGGEGSSNVNPPEDTRGRVEPTAYAAVDCGLPRPCKGRPIGTVVYAVNNPQGAHDPATPGTFNNPDLPANDFALIRLLPDVPTQPSMCFFGGPLTLLDKEVREPFRVRFYGQGQGTGYLPGRAGPLSGRTTTALRSTRHGTPYETKYSALLMPAPSSPGDSGGPIMTEDGKALGISGRVPYSTLLAPSLDRARKKLHRKFELLKGQLHEPQASPDTGVDRGCTVDPDRGASSG